MTVEDVEQLHIDAWQLGHQGGRHLPRQLQGGPAAVDHQEGRRRGLADEPAGSEAEAHARELSAKIAELEAALAHEQATHRRRCVVGAVRERLPRRRKSIDLRLPGGRLRGLRDRRRVRGRPPGEVFMKVSKQGSTLAGIMDAFSISVSLGLQHGVPLATYVRKYTNMRFEPAGITDDPDLRIATSLVDYIFRRLAVDYLPLEERAELGVLSTAERMQPTLPGVEETATPSSGIVEAERSTRRRHRRRTVDAPPATRRPGGPAGGPAPADGPLARAEQRDAPYCYQCGNAMQRAGSCYVCASCGTTSGCS